MSRIRGIECNSFKYQRDNIKNNGIDKKKKDIFCCNDDPEKAQIADLIIKLPKLDKIFELHRKIGEGTFSSVYLGSLRQHANLPDSQKRWFAIKHLVPTAHPARIEHELRCLQDMGGKHNVIGIELCLRYLDTIVFVMPYIPHKKFSEYVSDMDAVEVCHYMRALLVALKHVHSFGVIHRDVKPSNFLYDRENKRYLLVDFGLAQRVCPPSEEPPPPPPPAHTNNHKRLRDEDTESSPSAKRVALDLSMSNRTNGTGRVNSVTSASIPLHNLLDTNREMLKRPLTKNGSGGRLAGGAGAGAAAAPGGCACGNVGGVCTSCMRRPNARAPRAGTQGFRPPEVLLKWARQGTAVDTWACGVILASLLTGRYPFFRAADDVSALAELADLLGTEALQRTATSLGRRVVMSGSRPGLCLRRLARRLRSPPAAAPAPAGAAPCPRCRQPAAHCLCLDAHPSVEGWSTVAERGVCGFPESAFLLAERLLDPHPGSRVSAQDALCHDFLTATQ